MEDHLYAFNFFLPQDLNIWSLVKLKYMKDRGCSSWTKGPVLEITWPGNLTISKQNKPPKRNSGNQRHWIRRWNGEGGHARTHTHRILHI